MVPRLRSLVAPAAVALALAAPGAALAQGGAGDDQYADPFGSNDQQQQGSSGGSGSGSSGSQGTSGTGSSPTTPSGSSTGTSGSSTTTAPATTSSSSTSTTAQAAPTATAAGATSGAQLPYTGANAGLIALAGALLLGGGVALRVRLRDEPRHD
jgi:LPXTG-motif cell wall-anchored protein